MLDLSSNFICYTYGHTSTGNYSATAFKKPAAASFQPDRFYETLNKAQSSISNDNQYDYNQRQELFSSEDYDDPKYGNSYKPHFSNSRGGYGYNKPGM